MVDISAWQLLLVLNKVFIYGCIAATLGGPLTLAILNHEQPSNTIWQPIIYRYCLLAALAGLLFLVTYLLFETAAFSESGLAGLLDIDTFLILWDSPIGQATLYRMCSFMVFLLGTTLLIKLNIVGISVLSIVGYLTVAYLFAKSFSSIGHSTSLHIGLQALLSLHVLMVMIWLGSLYPLWLCCHKLTRDKLYKVMHCFGCYAGFVVSLLTITGTITVYQLITSFNELFNSHYGQGFVIKLLLSIGLFLIAAVHKWLLVPKLLTTDNTHHILARSIRYEMGIAVSILFVSAVITTLTGPSHLM